MGLLTGQSIIESQQFTEPGVLKEFAERAALFEDMLKQKERCARLQGRHGMLEFYEPSTRTRVSFETAVRYLGGSFSFSENAEQFSSAAKGERLEHSLRVLAGYHHDFIILRHKQDTAAESARDYLQAAGFPTPVINAGCGMGQHPTQALTDWWTIRKEFGKTEGLRLLIAGDLARGRTARSLAYLFGRVEGVKIDFVSPPQLRMGNDIIAYLKRHGVEAGVYNSLDEVIGLADVLYMTRVQKEREHNGLDLRTIDVSPYRLTVERAQRMRQDAIIMHPMPIVDEIEPPVDQLKHARYFSQSDNGLPVRMALLDMVLS